MVKKPETMCTEVGCTREWTTVMKQIGYPDNAPVSSTVTEKRVCDPCFERTKFHTSL